MSWLWVLAPTIYLTWMMNITGNSLLLALLVYLSLNIVMVGYLPLTTAIPAYILLIVFAWIIVSGILYRYGPEHLVKEAT